MFFITIWTQGTLSLMPTTGPNCSYTMKFSLVSKTLWKNSASLVYVVISPQMVFVAGQILTSLLAMLTLNWRRVSMEVPHVTGYRVPVDELVADCALDFIAI